MKRNHQQRSIWVILTVLLVAGLPAVAEGGTRGAVDLAVVKAYSGGIDLAPNVRYERAVLTISGVGRTFTLEFDSYTWPSITPFDAAGELLPDGNYRWELELVPNAETARGLRESAAANGGEPLRPWLPKTGTFAVRGGIFATPDVREATARQSESAERSVRAGRRADVPAQHYGGQVLGAEKNLARRRAAIDTDEAVGAGAGETDLFKAGRGTSTRVRTQRESLRSTQSGPDSDLQATEVGVSAERVLVPVVKAHELNQPNPRPRSDGANGRPRSDR